MLYVCMEEGDAWELLTRAVRQVWGMEALPEVVRLPGGKPVFSAFPNCHFSLSHSGGLALCALSDAPVGADIERLRPRRPGLPAYALNGTEYERYLNLGGGWPAFYVLWTEKESIVKYTGEGLRAWRNTPLPSGCVISPLSGADWRGAVCARERVEAVSIV